MSISIDYPYNQTTASEYLVCECASGADRFLLTAQDKGAAEEGKETPPVHVRMVEDSPSLIVEAPQIIS